MKVSIFTSVFFAICLFTVFSGLYFWKKTDKKQNGIIWIGFTAVTVMCFHVLVAAVINLIHIPVNIVTLGIADLVLGGFFWYRVVKKEEKQELRFEWCDLLFFALLVLVVLVFAVKRYGTGLALSYATIDPAAHFQDAMNVVNRQKVANMFYASLNNALLIELFGAFTAVSNYYKIFILADIWNFFLAGMVFYGAIRRYGKDRFTKIAAMAVTFLYLFGYPLNNTLFGFVYLGMGITIIAYLVAMTDCFLKEEGNRYFLIFCMSLGCLGIFESYVLFMPVVFFSIFLIYAWKMYRKKMLFSKETVVTELAIFLIPCIFGLMYTYFGVFSGDTTVGSAIANEGHIYRDLYSNFLPFLPFALYGFYKHFKARELSVLNLLLPFLSVFVLALFGMGMVGKVSSYYYYKNYYLLWLFVFLWLYIGIASIEKSTRGIIVCCFGVWALVAGMYLVNAEERIQARNELFAPMKKADQLNDVYSYNYQILCTPGYDGKKVELYQYVYKNLLQKGIDAVPLAGYWEDDYWYQGITNQRLEGYNYWNEGEKKYFSRLEKEAEYVLVLKESEFYDKHKKYFDKLEKSYENEAGFVAKVKDR